VCAAILPLVPGEVSAVLAPLWIVVPAVCLILVRFAALRSDEQPLSPARASSRAPPAASARITNPGFLARSSSTERGRSRELTEEALMVRNRIGVRRRLAVCRARRLTRPARV
jgi:hypothetical protein